MRLPGFEPGLQAWEAYVITAGPQPLAHVRVSSLIKRLRIGDFTLHNFTAVMPNEYEGHNTGLLISHKGFKIFEDHT